MIILTSASLYVLTTIVNPTGQNVSPFYLVEYVVEANLGQHDTGEDVADDTRRPTDAQRHALYPEHHVLGIKKGRI